LQLEQAGVSGVGYRLTVDLVLGVVVMLFAAPLLWLIMASIGADGVFAGPAPTTITGDNFSAVLTWGVTGRPLLNGLLISGGAAVVTVLVAVPAAYSLSRYQLRFGQMFLYTILFATGLPLSAMMVPVYGLFVRLKLVDSLAGTTLFLATTSLPMAIWMTKNFVDGVPLGLEEAARTDGASHLQRLRHIVLPLTLPGIMVVAIVTFITTWGNFFVPFILLLDPGKQPASVNIFSFFGEHGAIAYGQLAAYSIIFTTPVLGLYLLASKALGGGFTLAGAIKA
jgi:multiple sugar transport system permease protein